MVGLRRARGSSRLVLAVVFALVLTGCVRTVAHRPLSAAEYQKTDFSALAAERFWGDVEPENIEAGFRDEAAQLTQIFPDAVDATTDGALRRSLLAISGGSANGAFGVGVLAGWTESGQRPEFSVVTGISTGAMIAPFAFLGPDYDDTLVEIYSSVEQEDIFLFRWLTSLFFRSAIADVRPLKRLVNTYVTPELVEKIAEEHRQLRKLFIVTTHFDAMRPMVWDIGAIAVRRGRDAVPLIRQIILASASIPVLFPPVPIEIDVDNKRFTELHVDGAVSTQVFAYPAQMQIGRLDKNLGINYRRDIYVIQNSNVSLEYEPSSVRVVPIAWRAMMGLLTSKINTDVERIYFLANRDRIDFNMVSIPEEFRADRSSDFDPVYMKDLLELGRDVGRQGDFWFDKPPSER